MLGSLRARLIISFALVVALAVFLAGAGALFLLRDKQQETARDRYGRLADPLADRLQTYQATGTTLDKTKELLNTRADELDARILLLDQDQSVIFDSEDNKLNGKFILAFETKRVAQHSAGGVTYQYVDYNQAGEQLTLFTVERAAPDQGFAAPNYEALIAIPQSRLTSAWLDLVPRLALAGAIALSVSFVVSYFISRSISGPLARITEASKQMAQGDYDVHIPIRGQDEVGRLSEAFNQMAREVGHSHQMMKDLLANVSHELKTPLTSIQGFSQAMVDGVVQSDDDVKEYSRTIHEEANRMRALVDDLLLLSQLETGQVEMQQEDVDLRALLEYTLERFQFAIRDAGIESGLRVERIPDVVGDPRRLEQVFSNLIQNAVRHTPIGGIITVTARTISGGHTSVGVHNTGSFIPKDDLPRVFERLFQVDRARTRKGGSSGLGLSIVREIVEAHGGTVRAVSSEETGTEFVIVFPNPKTVAVRHSRAATEPKPSKPRSRPAAAPRTAPP